MSEQLALKFMLHLSKATRTIRMYSPNHPAVRRGADEAYEVVNTVLEETGQIVLGRRDNQLFFGDKQLRENNDAATRFLDLLGDLEIDTLTMDPGLGAEELFEFVKLVGTRDKDSDPATTREAIGAFSHIHANAIQYVAVSAKTGDVLDKIDDETLAKLAALDKGQLDLAINNLASELNAVAQLPEGQREHALQRRFAAQASQLVEGGVEVNELGEQMMKLIGDLSPEVQESLFGTRIDSASALDHDQVRKRLELTFKAGVVANELRDGAEGDADWRQRVERLMNSSQDVVGLAESIAGQVTLADGNLDQDSMSRLLQVLQEQAKPEGLAGNETILVAEADAAAMEQYKTILERSGVQLITCASGSSALRMAKDLRPDCVVLARDLPELDGLSILAELAATDAPPKAILYAESAAWREDPAFVNYPHAAYLISPFEANDFLAAFDQLVIRDRNRREAKPQNAVEAEQQKEDLDKARRVQGGLLPRRLPDLGGFELGAYYNACRDVGGDYFDFFELDDDHTGFLVADVAGKGFSAAMVMCMARTVFHSMVKSTLSPRQLMVRVNEIIHRDLVHGMFLTAMYVVLNHRTGQARLCSAGHNPALIYKHAQRSASYTKPSGIALGLVDNTIFADSLEETRMHFADGDLLVMYTDGVIETIDAHKEEFGEDRLAYVVSHHPDRDTQDLLGLIVAAIKQHQGAMPQFDDVTLVGLRNLGDEGWYDDED